MDKKNTSVKDRILQYTDYKKITKEFFFKNLGVSYGNFKGKAKEKALSSDVLAKIISKYTELNSEWLLTGEGTMLKNENDVSRQIKGNNNIQGDGNLTFGIERKEENILIKECKNLLIEKEKEIIRLLTQVTEKDKQITEKDKQINKLLEIIVAKKT